MQEQRSLSTTDLEMIALHHSSLVNRNAIVRDELLLGIPFKRRHIREKVVDYAKRLGLSKEQIQEHVLIDLRLETIPEKTKRLAIRLPNRLLRRG